ncbi:MAG: metallophosphoesterase [Thermoproteales archaeon]|nr:metallophosphoesterase [Thermoproteales archaeon]
MKAKTILTILVLTVVLFSIISFAVPKIKLRSVREVVEYPRPSLPEVVVWNGELLVKVNASQNAKNWIGYIENEHCSYKLELTSSDYREGLWFLAFKIPDKIPPLLYDLRLEFYDGEEKSHIQPRSVRVLKDWPEKLAIGHITDIHLPGGAQVYARCVYELNLISPHIIIATGDIVDVDTIRSAWQYYFFLSQFLKTPIFLLPGNHDHAGDDAKNYQKFATPLYWYTIMGPYMIAAIDTRSDGFATIEELEWLDQVLSEHPDKVKILAFHHPIIDYPGGEIKVDPENVEQIKNKMYPSWAENLEEAGLLLKTVIEHDVRLMLAGHIHRDSIAIINDKHYLFVKEPSGGSVREGAHYQSYRIIYVSENGEVDAIMHEGKGLFEYPNSLPVGMLTYYYTPVNDGSSSAVSLRVDNGLKADMPIVAEFKVKPGEEYKIYGLESYEVETYEVEGGILYLITAKVPAESQVKVTLASTPDNVKPEITDVKMVDEEGTKYAVIETYDKGWGVADVSVKISVNGGEWKEVKAYPLVVVDKDEGVTDTYEKPLFKVELPGQGKITLKVTAVDFANNKSEEITKEFVIEAEKPEEKPQPPTEAVFDQILIFIAIAFAIVVIAILLKKKH